MNETKLESKISETSDIRWFQLQELMHCLSTPAVAPQRIILLEQDLMRAIRIIASRHLHLNWPFGGSRFSGQKKRNQHLRMSSDLPRFLLYFESHLQGTCIKNLFFGGERNQISSGVPPMTNFQQKTQSTFASS